MASASELVSYQGNPLTGLGSNSIPVTSTGDLGVINQGIRDIMLMNHENNLTQFKQKVADRDALYSLLATGQAQVGSMREEDRKIYDSAKKQANDAFFKLASSGGINNKEALKEYKEKLDYLGQVSTQAQARYKFLGDLEKDAATETRGLIRDEMISNVEAQKGNFWGNLMPYQKGYDFQDAQAFNRWGGYGAFSGDQQGVPTATTDVQKVVNKDGKITTTNIQKTAPIKGKQPLQGKIKMKDGLPYRVQKGGKNFNWNALLNGVTTEYAENKDYGAEDQRFLKDAVQQLPVQQQQEILGTILKKAQQYNVENGFVPDENGMYPEGAIDINRLKSQFAFRDPSDASKGFYIGTSVPEFSALMTLARQDRFTTPDSEVFDKDVAKAMHDKAMEWIAKDKNNIRWRMLHSAEKEKTEIQEVGRQKINDLLNATETTLDANDPLVKEGSNGFIDVTKLPASRQFITGIVYKDGKPQVGQLKPFTITLPNGEVRQGYNTSYYNDGGKKIRGVKDLSPELEKQYTQFKQLYGKDGSWNNYLKALAKNGFVTPQFEGADGGAGTVNSIIEGQRFEAVKAGKKGFENIYEQEEITTE